MTARQQTKAEQVERELRAELKKLEPRPTRESLIDAALAKFRKESTWRLVLPGVKLHDAS